MTLITAVRDVAAMVLVVLLILGLADWLAQSQAFCATVYLDHRLQLACWYPPRN